MKTIQKQNIKSIQKLQVFYKEQFVGTLALTAGHKAAFAYDDAWLENGFSVSPFSLPLKKQVFIPAKDYFQGLFGVFADSLPDAWGSLLLSRLLERRGIPEDSLTILNRLAIVGSSGMGAFTYRPETELSLQPSSGSLDKLAEECRKLLNAEYSDVLDTLYRLGGTSGGARPKIMTQLQGQDWIIKFPAHTDGTESGRMEYEYALCAKQCGIAMTETRLFPSEICGGYFGTRRFDRDSQGDRIHMLTAAALLELDYRQPSLDYHSLMKLTKILTGNNREDTENMFRRMCFNIFAHNRDDHSKNFSYLYDEKQDCWRLSPAYDLTYSSTYYGEHTTTVDGNGKDPGEKELLAVGRNAGLSRAVCTEMISQIKNCVNTMLKEWVKPV